MTLSYLSVLALLSTLLISSAHARGLTFKQCKHICSRRSACGAPLQRSSTTAKRAAVRTGRVNAGGSCSSDADCSTGYACSASNTCNRIVDGIHFYVFANDYCELFINGKYQRFVPNGFDVNKFTYSGVCDDIIMKVVNTGDYISSAIVMEYGGWKHGSQGFHQPPNDIALPIYGRAKLSPEGNFTNNDPSYDYMSWKEAIYAQDMDATGNFPSSMKNAGADPVTSDHIHTPDDTVMGIRYEFPDCYT